ncbi:MAG TPA: TniQ family protein [Pyrinomonadaceae bacterium]|jgi:hypothetical protein
MLSTYGKITFKHSELQPVSRLYSLPPIGVGTSYVESLTGYITRLAENHSVSTGQLFAQELAIRLNRPYLLDKNQKPISNSLISKFGRLVHAVNGMDQTALDWAALLEKLTLQTDLKYLTMLPWRDILSRWLLLRRERAWCSQCFDECRETGGIVYEQLLWTINFVTFCTKHQIKLISTCPYCNKKSPIFNTQARAGYCYRCKKWLGAKSNAKTYNSLNRDLKEEAEISIIITELLALAHVYNYNAHKENLTHNLLYCAEKMANNNLQAFARFLEISISSLNTLCKKQANVRLVTLVNIRKRLNISIEMLLLHKISDEQVLPEVKIPFNLNKADKIRILKTALKDPQKPTLLEVAIKSGYSETGVLRSVDSKLCKQITARNLLDKPRKIGTVKKHSTEIIEKALKCALKENPPPTLQSVSNKLGYKYISNVLRRCPALSKQVVSRRHKYSNKQNKKLEESLKKALETSPPLPLDTIAKKLGYKGDSTLRYRFPELCIAISARFRKYKPKHQLISEALQSALTEIPPPSVRSVSKHLKINILSLYNFNSDLCYQIAERHSRFIKESALERREERYEEIRKVVRELHAKGIYPARERVSKLLKKSTIGRRDEREVLHEMQISLGVAKKNNKQ